MPVMKDKRSAIKHERFAAVHHRRKIDALNGPLGAIGEHIDFAAMA